MWKRKSSLNFIYIYIYIYIYALCITSHFLLLNESTYCRLTQNTKIIQIGIQRIGVILVRDIFYVTG